MPSVRERDSAGVGSPAKPRMAMALAMAMLHRRDLDRVAYPILLRNDFCDAAFELHLDKQRARRRSSFSNTVEEYPADLFHLDEAGVSIQSPAAGVNLRPPMRYDIGICCNCRWRPCPQGYVAEDLCDLVSLCIAYIDGILIAHGEPLRKEEA
jgi:hypothetical protein